MMQAASMSGPPRSALELQPERIANGLDEDGLLVRADGRLVAVLVRLSETHDSLAGAWFLEIGFHPGLAGNPVFEDLDTAQAWIAERVVAPA